MIKFGYSIHKFDIMYTQKTETTSICYTNFAKNFI